MHAYLIKYAKKTQYNRIWILQKKKKTMKYNFVFNFSNFLLKIASKLKITLVYDVVKLPIR